MERSQRSSDCLEKTYKTIDEIMVRFNNIIFRVRVALGLQDLASACMEPEHKLLSFREDVNMLMVNIGTYFLLLLNFIALYKFQVASFNFFGYVDKIGIQKFPVIQTFANYYPFFAKCIFWIIISGIIMFTSINQVKGKNLLWLGHMALLATLGAIITCVFFFGLNWSIDKAIDIYTKSLAQNSDFYQIMLGAFILVMSSYSIFQISQIGKRIIKYPLSENIIALCILIAMLVSLIACVVALKCVVIPSYTNITSIP